jgi:hypothetical protein
MMSVEEDLKAVARICELVSGVIPAYLRAVGDPADVTNDGYTFDFARQMIDLESSPPYHRYDEGSTTVYHAMPMTVLTDPHWRQALTQQKATTAAALARARSEAQIEDRERTTLAKLQEKYA